MKRVQKSSSVAVVVDASAAQVWAVVGDVTRTGEWSHECRTVEWVGDATRTEVGARFRGSNRAGPWRWSRACEVVRLDAPHAIAWRTLPTRFFPDSTEWALHLDPLGSRTRITQTFQVVQAPPLLDVVYARLVPTHRDRDARLRADLARIGVVAARR